MSCVLPSNADANCLLRLTLLLTVAMNLFTHYAMHQVLIKLLMGFRLIWHDPDFVAATKRYCYRHYRLDIISGSQRATCGNAIYMAIVAAIGNMNHRTERKISPMEVSVRIPFNMNRFIP